MKRTYIALVLFAAAAYAPAPIIDQRPGQKPQAEMTQEQIAAQQQYQTKIGEMGASPSDTEPNMPISGQTSSDGAGSALKAGSSFGSGSLDEEKAAAALKEAAKGKKGGGGISMLWIAILACVLGFGAVAGFRAWVNRAIPVPDEKTRYRL